MERNYYLLAFDSTHAAMAAQRELSPLLPVAVMPTLRQITVSCGISLRVEEKDYTALEGALRRGAVPRTACRLYRVEGPRVWEV